MTGTNGLPPPRLSEQQRREANTRRLIAHMQRDHRVRAISSLFVFIPYRTLCFQTVRPEDEEDEEERDVVQSPQWARKDPFNLYLDCEEAFPHRLAKARSATHFIRR